MKIKNKTISIVILLKRLIKFFNFFFVSFTFVAQKT